MRQGWVARLAVGGLTVGVLAFGVAAARLASAALRQLGSTAALSATPTNSSQPQPDTQLSAPSPPVRASGESAREGHGFCSAADAGPDSKRTRYLSRFSKVSTPHAELRVDPGLDPIQLMLIEDQLESARDLVTRSVGSEVEAPTIYVYSSKTLFRLAECADRGTDGFYDGAIHLAASPGGTMRANLVHEYTHHALFHAGIWRPAWLQEGVAMHLAGDPWRGWLTLATVRPLAQMTLPPVQGTKPSEIEAFYGQAYIMVSFLEELCRRSSARPSRDDTPLSCSLPRLIDTLRAGSVAPEALFEWAARQWSDVPVSESWPDYVATALR